MSFSHLVTRKFNKIIVLNTIRKTTYHKNKSTNLLIFKDVRFKISPCDKRKQKMTKKIIKIFLSLFFIMFLGWTIKWIYSQFGRINFDEIAIAINSGFASFAPDFPYAPVNLLKLIPFAK